MTGEPSRWKRYHRVRHALSTRAFGWLARRRMLRCAPGERFVVNEQELRLPRLPTDLDGLRIAHVSDLHVGPLMRPEHLPPIVAAINDLGADLIANTGDIVDYSNHYLSPVVGALGKLKAPLGVYHVLGNHDYRDAAAEVVHAFRMADLSMLVNEHVRVEVHSHRLAVAGIDWAERDRSLARLVHRACEGIYGDDLRVLLAHHPHALDAASRHNVDLVLSGHTHGGQVILRKGAAHSPRPSLGLGNLNFRYPQGHYQKGRTHLFVTNGLGGSFPLRFRCPAEINVLRLRPGG